MKEERVSGCVCVCVVVGLLQPDPGFLSFDSQIVESSKILHWGQGFGVRGQRLGSQFLSLSQPVCFSENSCSRL